MPTPDPMPSRDEILKRLKLDPEKIKVAFEQDDEPPAVTAAQTQSIEALRGLGSFELEEVDITRGDRGYDVTVRMLVDPKELGSAQFDVSHLRINDRRFERPSIVRQQTLRRQGQVCREFVLRARSDEAAARELLRAPALVVEGRLTDGRRFWGLKNSDRAHD